MSIDTAENRFDRRVADLYAHDAQFAAARPRPEVTAAIEQAGSLPRLLEAVFTGYADRPALGRRAVRLVEDPHTRRTTTELLPEFGPEPTDLVLRRWHGLGPMGGTDLDAVLRNLGVTTIVAVGVSVNVAITNLVMDAVNAAYRVVLPRDAVAGIPSDYAAAVIDNTLSLLATITTTDELLEAWR